MEQNAAAEHLQVIRTLMERSALYRRALAPIMTFAGLAGTVAAIGDWGVCTAQGFLMFWYGVAAVTVLGALLLTRRQALKDREPFWSPPTRRVVLAMQPALTAGLLIGVAHMLNAENLMSQPVDSYPPPSALDEMVHLPAIWAVLYGCALHAAGFFTPRGLRWFGWIMVGCGLAFVLWDSIVSVALPEWGCRALMGFFFGVLHLAYGVYLYVTEKRKTAA